MQENKEPIRPITWIIVGIAVIFIAGYFGFNQFTKYQAQKSEEERLAQTAKTAQDLEIEKLKEEMEVLKNAKPQTIIKQVPAPQTQEISASELDPYLTGAIKVSCKKQEGSGTLWQFDSGNYVLTNYHVVSKPYPNDSCSVVVHEKNSSNGVGVYNIYTSTGTRWNSYTDVSLLRINEIAIEGMTSLPVQNLNYKIGSLRKCSPQMALGLPVIVLGYPAFSLTQVIIQGQRYGEQTVRTITNGIISAYDSSETEPYGKLPYPNYFISAKIDSGNSGGIAFSKDSSGLCVLGIPTWLSLGNYETQGIVQNIHNILYKQ